VSASLNASSSSSEDNHTVLPSSERQPPSSSFHDPCKDLPVEPYNLYLHVGSIFILLGVSFLATIIPVVGKKHPRLRIGEFSFALGKNFGTGVILATGFIHMLCPANDVLTNDCLPPLFTEDYRAFAGLLALMACLTVQFVQSMAVLHTRAQHAKASEALPPITASSDKETQPLKRSRHGHHSHHHEEDESHVHTLLLDKDSANRRVTTYMLELGIATHSVIIGITLGVSRGSEFQGLLIALTCHQFFEGIALSTTVLDSGFKTLMQPIVVVIFYSLTTPTGIALGVGIAKTYNENSLAALLVQGLFDGVSGGVLIYDGLVNLLTANITNSKEFAARSTGAKIALYIALWLGAAAMAIVGRWA
jgi:zinc transporter 1/2/3